MLKSFIKYNYFLYTKLLILLINLFLLLIKNIKEKILVKISAAGKDSHTPVILKTFDKINIEGIINIKPLNIDIINAGLALSLAEK